MPSKIVWLNVACLFGSYASPSLSRAGCLIVIIPSYRRSLPPAQVFDLRMGQSYVKHETTLPGNSLEPSAEAGPLQRRISVANQPISSPAPDHSAIPHATIALLDGTVVGRLTCDTSPTPIVVGRSSLSTIHIDDPFVHRAHAQIDWDVAQHAHVITHGGGSNGTFVNLQRIDRPTRLSDGTRIRIGKTELVYRRIYYPMR
jgi:hypothetical protein